MNRSPMPPRRAALARGPVRLTRAVPLSRGTGTPRQPAQRRQGRPNTAGWPQDTRDRVSSRSRGVCEIGAAGCTGRATNVHHRLPLRMGGSRNPVLRTPANALHVCGDGNTSGCHRFVDDFPRIAGLAGWKLPAGSDPAAVPVRYRCRSLVWLTEDGDVVGEVAA